jgi:hypothetical protein
MTHDEIRTAAIEHADRIAVETQMKMIAGTLAAFSMIVVIATLMSAIG